MQEINDKFLLGVYWKKKHGEDSLRKLDIMKSDCKLIS